MGYNKDDSAHKSLFYRFVKRAVVKDIMAKTPTLQEEKKTISDAKKLLEETLELNDISATDYVSQRRELLAREEDVNKRIRDATPVEHTNKEDTGLLDKGFASKFYAEVKMAEVAKDVLAPLDEDKPALEAFKAKKAKKEAKKADKTLAVEVKGKGTGKGKGKGKK